MTQIQIIPLAKLKVSPDNTRKNGSKKVDDLVASISAHGLRHNLTVVEAETGYEVVAGGRRLRALQQLAKAGSLPATLADGVPCMLVNTDTAAEISLAENTIREPMHPIDQFNAFQAMADDGEPTADIAARFGVTELVVRQRMRLSRVSPKLLKIYGDGGMTLDQLQAFAVSDDHGRQEAIWKRAKGNDYYQKPEQLRRELASKETGKEDPRVQLVGLAAYESAGGRLRRDLFSDEVFVEDLGLLEQLVTKQLEHAADLVRAEGWKWVEVGGERPAWNAPRIEHPGQRELSKGESAEVMKLAGKPNPTVAEQVRLTELYDPNYTTEQRAASGARVVLDTDGELIIHRGLLRKGDKAPASADLDDDEPEGVRLDDAAEPETGSRQEHVLPKTQPQKESSAIPQRSVAELTLIRTAHLRVAMANDPVKAITVLTARMAESWRRGVGFISGSGVGIQFHMGPDAGKAYGEQAKAWKETLAFRGSVFDWLREQPWDTTAQLLAFLVAESLDVVKRYSSDQFNAGDVLAEYLEHDMADHWRPDSEFMTQLPSAAIFAALEEIRTSETKLRELRKLKKAQLADHAAALLAPTRWVPECIRSRSKGKPKPAHKATRKGK